MDQNQLIDSLESAIKVWRVQQEPSNGPPATKASAESGRKAVLAAAQSLVTALEGPRNILVQISKMV